MNTYEISIQRENGTTCTDRVVAATPAEAKKFFREIYRHGEAFQSKDLKVELVAENTPATKDQEREALEKIKAILDTLGPDSYVGTAFEGCLEIAEENIENDFACSMKQRVEAVVIENTRLKEKVKELEKEVSTMALDNRDLRLAIKKEKEEASATETALRERAVSDDDLTDCVQMARNAAYEWGEKMEQASASIVELADDPTSPEFAQAVKDHRNAKRSKEYYEALADRLEKKQRYTAGA